MEKLQEYQHGTEQIIDYPHIRTVTGVERELEQVEKKINEIVEWCNKVEEWTKKNGSIGL